MVADLLMVDNISYQITKVDKAQRKGELHEYYRIRIIKGETMVIESESDELGTELTLHRVP